MMNKILRIFILFVASSVYAFATFTIQFQAGNFTDRSGGLLLDGSLGILVADTDGSGFSGLVDGSSDLIGSSLSVGNTLGASNVLILGITASSDIGTGGGGFSDFYSLNYSGDFGEGDDLGFYWFPEIDIIGSTISPSTDYGFYSSSVLDADAGADVSFTDNLPDSGSYSLATFDSSIDGSSPDPSFFQAQFTSAVPEPSTYALFAGVLTLGYIVVRRRRSIG